MGVLCGFLTNCCVESTMRTAFEKGFNVVTLTDCCATTSEEGQKAATTGTFGMFSTPMTANEFQAKMPALPAVQPTPTVVATMDATMDASRGPQTRKSVLSKLN